MNSVMTSTFLTNSLCDPLAVCTYVVFILLSSYSAHLLLTHVLLLYLIHWIILFIGRGDYMPIWWGHFGTAHVVYLEGFMSWASFFLPVALVTNYAAENVIESATT